MGTIVKNLEDLELLKLQHQEWDKLLKEEQERPLPDALKIQTYKRHKLELKQQIEEVERQLFK